MFAGILVFTLPLFSPILNKDAGKRHPCHISTTFDQVVLTIWSNWYFVFRIVIVIVPILSTRWTITIIRSGFKCLFSYVDLPVLLTLQ